MNIEDRPKVWFVSGFSPHIWGGGVEEAVNVVSNRFAAEGADVSIFHGVSYNRPQKRAEVLPDNLSLTEISQGRSFSRYLRFRALIEANRPDMAIVNMPGRIGISAALALKEFSVPTIFWWHGNHILSPAESDYQHSTGIVRRLVRKIVFNPLKIAGIRISTQNPNFNHVACSGFTIDTLENKGILPAGMTKVLNPPSETGLCYPDLGNKPHLDEIREDDVVIFIPARVAPDKQFYNVRELLAKLKPSLKDGQRVNFVSAGPTTSPGYLAYAFPIVDTTNLKTTYLGVLDRRGMEKVYSRAQCVFMPNRAEMFGLSTVEAMRFGVPVLGFKTGGTAEILREFPDYPQYLIPEGRGQIRIDPVKDFLEGAQDKKSAGLHQRDRVLERFDPQRLSGQVYNFVIQNLMRHEREFHF